MRLRPIFKTFTLADCIPNKTDYRPATETSVYIRITYDQKVKGLFFMEHGVFGFLVIFG